MGLFNKKPKENAAPTSAPVATVDLTAAPPVVAKSNGLINLEKGSRIKIDKSPVIRAKATWSSKTDYDLYAIVLMKNGEQKVVSTFGSKEQPSPTPTILDGKIRHLGDVGRQSTTAEETIEIVLTDDVAAVVPIAYSAQSNGTGSFYQYNVSLSLDNGQGTNVTIDAKHANKSSTIYTVAIGIIINTPDGVIIEGLESYSKPGSELRPAFVKNEFFMDAGSRNLYK